MSPRAAAVAAVVAVVVGASTAACSGSDAPDASPTPSASPSGTPGPAGCSLLGAADRDRLVGSAVDQVTDAGESAPGAQCRWEAGRAYVQVSSLDAAQWAKALPALIASLKDTNRSLTAADRADLDRLTAVLKKQGLVTADEACRLFPRLAAVAGGDGSAVLVTYVPTAGGGTGVQAQTCTDGLFTSVVFSGPGVTESSAVTSRARAGLDVAHENALERFDDSAPT